MNIKSVEVSGHNGSWKKATGIFTLNKNYYINNSEVFTNKNDYHLYRRENGKWIIGVTKDMIIGKSRGCIASNENNKIPINLTWRTRRHNNDEAIKVNVV